VKVTYTFSYEQDDIPVRGNAIASGDEAFDKQVEDEIIEALNRGEDWQWALARVIASVEVEGETYRGDTYLGACSYRSESDLKSGVFEDMKAEALYDLKRNISEAIKRGEIAQKAIGAL
jgi:hypothetical protein